MSPSVVHHRTSQFAFSRFVSVSVLFLSFSHLDHHKPSFLVSLQCRCIVRETGTNIEQLPPTDCFSTARSKDTAKNTLGRLAAIRYASWREIFYITNDTVLEIKPESISHSGKDLSYHFTFERSDLLKEFHSTQADKRRSNSFIRLLRRANNPWLCTG
jgi:hypothetical protein